MGRGGELSFPSTSGYDHLTEVPSAGFEADPKASQSQHLCACMGIYR